MQPELLGLPLGAVTARHQAVALMACIHEPRCIPQVVVLERDAQIPEQPAGEVYTDGNEYARDGVARRGVPQYVQIHGMLAKVGSAWACGVSRHSCLRRRSLHPSWLSGG